MAIVTFTNGNSYNDTTTPPGNMGAGGHRTNLIPMLDDTVTEVQIAVTKAAEATQAAQDAANVSVNALQATSTTSHDIGTGSKLYVINTNQGWQVGMFAIIAQTSSPSNFNFGQVTAVNAGTPSITVNVTDTGGSGAGITAWSISASGPKGPQGDLDFSTLSAETAVDTADEFVFRDDSAGVNKKITKPNLVADLAGEEDFAIQGRGRSVLLAQIFGGR